MPIHTVKTEGIILARAYHGIPIDHTIITIQIDDQASQIKIRWLGLRVIKQMYLWITLHMAPSRKPTIWTVWTPMH